MVRGVKSLTDCGTYNNRAQHLVLPVEVKFVAYTSPTSARTTITAGKGSAAASRDLSLPKTLAGFRE
jgi:hypothetical protein